MAKELPGYRDQLESVIAAFPDKECLTVRDTARYTGFTEKTAATKFPFVGHGLGRYITRTSLARTLVDVNAKKISRPGCYQHPERQRVKQI